MRVYGLSTCVVCQRACKTLEAEGIEIEFRDVRSDPLSESELNELLNEFNVFYLFDTCCIEMQGFVLILVETS